jgi:orotidine-5'-phosphate decarboxylase
MPLSSPVHVAERLFVALDYPQAAPALALAERLAPLGVSYKVGMQLFYAAGPSLLETLQAYGKTVFVDLKLHDIPNTVAGAVDALVRRGVGFLNVHASGGPEMMHAAVEAARDAADATGRPKPTIIGVTLLTSLSERDLRNHLFVESASVEEYVQHLAIQSRQCGLDGVVCSAREAAAIRTTCGPDFLLVTPGIRPGRTETQRPETAAIRQDQARVITPAEALKNGADYLVVGRPITAAADPAQAAEDILNAMRQGLE